MPQASATNIAAITASSTATLYVIQTSTPMQIAGLSVGGSGGTVTQGNAGSNAQAWWTQIGDGTNGPVAVKAASTAAATSDPSLVFQLSPNDGDTGFVQATPVTIGIEGSDNRFQDFVRAECVVVRQRRRLIGHLVGGVAELVY